MWTSVAPAGGHVLVDLVADALPNARHRRVAVQVQMETKV